MYENDYENKNREEGISDSDSEYSSGSMTENQNGDPAQQPQQFQQPQNGQEGRVNFTMRGDTQNNQNTQNAQNTQSTQNTQNTGATNARFTQPSGNGYSGAGFRNAAGQAGYGSSQNDNSNQFGSQNGSSNQFGSQNGMPYQNGAGTQPHYATWQHNPNLNGTVRPERAPKSRGNGRKHSIAGKIAGITAAALLFGVIAGGTMTGINVVTNRYLASAAPAVTESKSALAEAQTLPAVTPETGAAAAAPAISNDVSAIVAAAMPSVVAINSTVEYQTQNFFGMPQTYQGKGSGSGIIVGESDSELLIVTNNHVVEGSKELSVTFNDNEAVNANVKGTDSENDLAVIAVSLSDIKDDTKSKIAVATLGDSDALKVGQGVVAIGNALGYGQSVTVGYVSALNREVKTDTQTTRNLLQTDAAINPGNSGGALLNMQGQVIGINSAKYSSTEVEGMGYAIPISKVHDIIDDLMTKKTRVQVETSKQGYLGIQGTDIDAQTAKMYGMPQGIYVYKIMEDGAAAASDLKEKDIITKFDGQSVTGMTDLKDMLTYYEGGSSVDLTVQSLQDGAYVERTVTITLGTRPADDSAAQPQIQNQ